MNERNVFIVLLVLLITCSVAWYGFMYEPATAEILQMKNELAELQAKLTSARKANIDLKNIEERFAQVQKKLNLEKSRFIRKDELSEVTSQMNSLARRYSLQLLDFSPALDNYFSDNEKARIVALPLVLSVRGSYVAVGKYIENWYQLPFYITGEEIDISAVPGTNGKLDVKITAKLYTWNE
jgi:Tfp pilus assembly protein PilO